MDPFAIQIPAEREPIHRVARRFSLARQRGYEILDYETEGKSGAAYLGVSIKPIFFRIFFLILTGWFFIFSLRAADLQISQGDRFRGLAEGNRIRQEKIMPRRGLFFDSRGQPLVENAPFLILAVRPIDFPRSPEARQEFIDRLEMVGLDYRPIIELAEKHRYQAEWLPIRENLLPQEAVDLAVKFRDFSFLSIQIQTRRRYRLDQSLSLSHLVGYLGKLTDEELTTRNKDRYRGDDFIGRTGLEASYEEVLRGRIGLRQIEVDALGREKEVLAKEDPVHGLDLILSLDLDLQAKAEEILVKTLKAAGKKRGAIVMLDPKNGEIRALVSWPAFDSNQFSFGLGKKEYETLINDPDQPLFNRALAGTYPSGSIIKPIWATAALVEGIITPQTTVLSTGGLEISRWFFPDWKEGGHGLVDVYRAVAESVNTFFYYLSGGYGRFEGLGPDKMAQWARRFGLGLATGIDLKGESNGLIPTRDWKESERGEPWYIGDTYHLAIGQGDLLVTPLQMAVATATLANGGKIIQPRLVRSQKGPGGEINQKPRILFDSVASPETLAIVVKAMRQAVTAGSARLLADLPWPVAGKTGTAQWRRNYSPHAWFVGFTPLDQPKLVISVLVEEGGEGSALAVPLAKEILAWWMSLDRDKSN